MDDCIRCGAQYTGNTGLLSMPRGKLVVVDRLNHRIWRICSSCGSWGLEGSHATGRVLAEIASRLPHASGDSAFHTEQLGSATIHILPAVSERKPRSDGGLFRKMAMSRDRKADRVIAMIAAISLLAIELAPAGFAGAGWRSLFVAGLVGLSYIVGMRAGDLRRRGMLGFPVIPAWPARFIGVTCALVLAMLVIDWPSPWAAFTGLAVAIGMLLSEDFIQRFMPPGNLVRLSGNHVLNVDDRLIRSLIVGVTQSGSISVRGLGRDGSGEVDGTDAALVLDRVGRRTGIFFEERDLEDGWLLLRQHYDIDGLASAVCELSTEGRDGVPWNSIPTVWRAALIIGSSEAIGSTGYAQELLKRLNDETVVATIAGDLERESSRP
jgi:hypothetical protein